MCRSPLNAVKIRWSGIAVMLGFFVGLGTFGGCGYLSDDGDVAPLDEVPDVRLQALSDFCSVELQAHGTLDLESEYLPSVVACENGNAPMEALKAQAVAARSHALYEMGRYVAGQREALEDNENDQVYGCDYAPVEQRHIDAVEATKGQVLMSGDLLTAGMYAAGAEPSTPSCVAAPGDPDTNPSTEQWVTYNEHKTGNQVQPTPLGNENDPKNRGLKSQNGSSCLADKGWDYERILRFYYGDDIRIRIHPDNECTPGAVDGSPGEGGAPERPPSQGDGDGAVCHFERGDQGSFGGEQCTDASQRPSIQPRQSWNPADPRHDPPPIGPVEVITVHHSGAAPHNDYESRGHTTETVIGGMQNHHMNHPNLMWRDIGYHYVIGWDGTIYDAHPDHGRGIHVGSHNTGNLGINLVGHFSIGSVKPTAEQLTSLQRLLRHLTDEHGVELVDDNFYGHRDWPGRHASNDCPGDNFYPSLSDVVASARADRHCQDQQPDPDADQGFRYVRVSGIDASPTTDDDPVDGFEVDAVYATRDGDTVEASGVVCSPGVSNASAAKGLPDNDSCENRVERVAGVPEGSDLVMEFSDGLTAGDTLHVHQFAYQAAMAPCEPTGTARVSVSRDGSNWKVVGESVQGNWNHTLEVDQLFGDATQDEVWSPEEGFGFIEPQAGGSVQADMTFKAQADLDGVAEVEYFVPEQAFDALDEDWVIGSSTDASSGFAVDYTFENLGERMVGVRAVDADGQELDREVITVTVVDADGQIPEGDGEDTPSPLADMDQAMADSLHQEGGRCYSQFDDESDGDRCQDGQGGWSSGLGWHFVKRAMERAGIDWTALESAGPCSWNEFHGSAYGFRCNANANPQMLENIGLRRVDVPTTEAPAGAIISWAKGCGNQSVDHGGIEISMGDGTACNDSCDVIDDDASCADVYIPIQ